MELNDVNKNTAITVRRTVITEAIRKMVVPISNMVLARLLAPEIFGIVASINVIITFTDMFTDAGFSKFIVQHTFKDDGELYEYANVAYWANLSVSVFLLALIIIGVRWIAGLLNLTGYENAICVAALALPITSMISVQQSIAYTKYNSKLMAKVRIISAFIPLIVTVPLAYLTKSYWALLIGNLASYLTIALIYCWKSGWIPKPYFRMQYLKMMFSFSMWTLFESITIWFSGNGIIMGVSYFLDKSELAYYTVSSGTINQFMSIITTTTIPTLFVSLSKLKDRRSEYLEFLYNYQRKTSDLVLPLAIGMFVFRDLLVDIFLGPQWVTVRPYVAIFALVMPLTVLINYYASEIYRSLGKPRLSTVAQMLYLSISMPVLMFSAHIGITSFIYTYAATTILFAVIHGTLLKNALHISVFRMLYNIRRSTIDAFLMGGIGLLFLEIFGRTVVTSIIGIILCSTIYFGLCMLRRDNLLYDITLKFISCRKKNSGNRT